MASKRSKKSTKPSNKDSSFNFKTLISSLSSPQVLNPETMEALYLLLLNLSCSESESGSESNSNVYETEFSFNDIKLKFKHIHQISNVLLDKLNAKFNHLFSALNDVKASVKELTLLLRCCIVVFKLLVLDQKLVIEKGRILLGILRKCVYVELRGENEKACNNSSENELLRECMYVDDDSTILLAEHLVTSVTSSNFMELSSLFRAVLCAVLEVFADELLMHESVRQYLLLADSLSCGNECVFICHFGHGNIASVLEVLSAHFILSISDDRAFKNFIKRLFWLPDDNFRVPEMTLTTALSLLLNPIMFSAPKMFQAYLILLVSEVIGISMYSEHLIPSSELRAYLSAFERSVALYTRHMSKLHTKGYPIVDDSFVKSHFRASYSQVDFESCLLPATKEKMHDLITKSDNLWNSYLSNNLLKERAELVAASVAYTKESLQVVEESSRDEILSIISCITLQGSSDGVDDTVLHKKEDTSPQDIFLLASILKLMSSAMLQAINILTQQGRNSGSLKTLENVALSKEYDFLVASFSCFQQFGIRLPVQKLLHDMMEIQPTRHKTSKWMFFHFSGLLSLSYASGLDFLVKNCIFTLVILLKLFVYEAGDLHAFGSLLDFRVKSSSHKSCVEVGKSEPSHNASEVLVDRKSSHAVALKFQKIRTLYLGTRSQTSLRNGSQEQEPGSLEKNHMLNHVESALSIEENTRETCNGEIFLRCVLEGSQDSSAVADLSDFIECKQGKDYSEWLRGREKFRRWKSEKSANFRWKKKRRAFQKKA